MAERLLISVWLTREHRDSHSLRRICRYGIEHVLIPFVKAPAIHDQTLSEAGQNLFVHVCQVVAPTNCGNFLLAGSLANKHRYVVPGRPLSGDRFEQIARRASGCRDFCLVTNVVASHGKTAVRVEHQRCSGSVPIWPPQVLPVRLKFTVMEGILEPATVRCIEQQHGPVQGEVVVQADDSRERARECTDPL